MRLHRYLALAALVLFVACEQTPTAPEEASAEALFKKGGKPGGGDPPPSVTDPVLLYASWYGGGLGRLGLSMYRMNVDGAFERVFEDAVESEVESSDPSFAPDGQQFVFSRNVVKKGGNVSLLQIARANLNGSGFTVLHEIEDGGGILRRPSWSPAPLGDGQEKISYLEGARDATGIWMGNDLFIMNVDGTERTRLTSHTLVSQGNVRVSQAEWSRTADRILAIIYHSDTDQFTRRLYTIDCATVCALTDSVDLDLSARLAPVDGFDQIDWARNSDRIATQVLPGDRYPGDLWIIDISDPLAPSFTQLTNTPSLNERNPTWSPDESQIAFKNYVDGIVRVYLMNADGTNVTAISGDIGIDFGNMDWQP
jgi:Tol biopolymer transport system component